MSLARGVGILILFTILPLPCDGAFRLRKSRLTRAAAAGLRNRLHVNPLITQPGTLEVEFGTAVDSSGSLTQPTLVKYTPDGDDAYWGNTEFSVGFDSVATSVQDGSRVTQFSDHLTFTALTGLPDSWTGKDFHFAIGPQVTKILRGDTGERIGLTSVGRYTRGLSSGGFTLSWNGATAASDSNPAGVFDVGGGFGRQLGKEGLLNNLTIHGNVLLEKSSGVQRTVSVFEGMEYQITNRFSIDVSGQHLNAIGGVRDNQISVGLVMNFGRIW